MVRILLCGCNGKMGKTISNLASSDKNLVIVGGIDKTSSSSEYPVFDNISKCSVEADVILDFSRPEALSDLISYSKEHHLPLVLCTTGYSKEQLEEIKEASKETAVFRSANMSIGINVLNNVLRQISSILYDNYDIEIIEKHHNQKVDSPSGTALLLANTIKDAIPEETNFVNGREGNRKRVHNEIGIHAIRGGSIVGEHEIIFAGQGEIIELKHTALSREVFAVGALKACAFMHNKKPGLYDMDNVLNQNGN